MLTDKHRRELSSCTINTGEGQATQVLVHSADLILEVDNGSHILTLPCSNQNEHLIFLVEACDSRLTIPLYE